MVLKFSKKGESVVLLLIYDDGRFKPNWWSSMSIEWRISKAGALLSVDEREAVGGGN